MQACAEKMEDLISEKDGQQFIGEYPVYSGATRLPLLPDAEFEELCQSIEADGLRHSILEYEGEIIDGRNRLLACLAIGIEPVIEPIGEHVDPDEVIILENLHRRNHTPSQRAILIAELRGVNTSGDDIAKEAGVSPRLAYCAKRVVMNGVPQLQQAVVEGLVSLDAAEVIAAEPKEAQEAMVGDFGDDTVDRRQATTGPAVKATTRKEVEKKKEKPFKFGKWEESAGRSLSKMIAKAPEGERERCTEAIGNMLSVRVRRSSDGFDAGFMEKNSETVVPLTEEMLDGMTKTERRKALVSLSEAYGQDDLPTNADDAIQLVGRIVEGLTKPAQKAFRNALMTAFPDQGAPKQYLPPLADDHEKALTQAKSEFQHRVNELKGFMEWDTAGRRDAAEKFRKAVQAATKRFSDHAMIDKDDSNPVDLPEHLQTERFVAAWQSWIKHRKGRSQSVSNSVQTQQMNTLKLFDEQQAVDIVQKAEEDNWKGIPISLRKQGWQGNPPAMLEGVGHGDFDPNANSDFMGA